MSKFLMRQFAMLAFGIPALTVTAKAATVTFSVTGTGTGTATGAPLGTLSYLQNFTYDPIVPATIVTAGADATFKETPVTAGTTPYSTFLVNTVGTAVIANPFALTFESLSTGPSKVLFQAANSPFDFSQRYFVSISASTSQAYTADSTTFLNNIFSTPNLVFTYNVTEFKGGQSYNFLGTATIVPSTPIMSAVPEPETYALLLAGMGLVGYVAKRSKKENAV